jgi:hypothetical protein
MVLDSKYTICAHSPWNIILGALNMQINGQVGDTVNKARKQHVLLFLCMLSCCTIYVRCKLTVRHRLRHKCTLRGRISNVPFHMFSGWFYVSCIVYNLLLLLWQQRCNVCRCSAGTAPEVHVASYTHSHVNTELTTSVTGLHMVRGKRLLRLSNGTLVITETLLLVTISILLLAIVFQINKSTIKWRLLSSVFLRRVVW